MEHITEILGKQKYCYYFKSAITKMQYSSNCNFCQIFADLQFGFAGIHLECTVHCVFSFTEHRCYGSHINCAPLMFFHPFTHSANI